MLLTRIEGAFGSDSSKLAPVLIALASADIEAGNATKALPNTLRAVDVVTRAFGNDHANVASARAWLARTYTELGRYEEALSQWRQVVAIYRNEHGARHVELLSALSHLAGAYADLGLHAESLALRKELLDTYSKEHGPSNPLVATALGNLAAAYAELGKFEEALALRQQALSIYSASGDKRLIATALHEIAGADILLSRFDEALTLQLRAVALFGEQPESAAKDASLAVAQSRLGEILIALGRNAEGSDALRLSMAGLERQHGPDHPSLTGPLRLLAKANQQDGTYVEAQTLLQRALLIGTQVNDRERLWRIQLALSQLASATGKRIAAIFWGKQAVNTIQSLRHQLQSLDKDLQHSFLDHKEPVFRHLSDLLVDAGRLSEAQEVLAMLKEEEYHHFIRRDQAHDPRATRASYTGQEAELNQRWDAAAVQLHALAKEAHALDEQARQLAKLGQKLGELETARREALRPLLKTAEDAYRQTLADIQATLSREAQRGDAAAQRLAEVAERNLDKISPRQRLLTDLGRQGNDAVLLEYIITEAKTYILVTSPKGVRAQMVEISAAELNRKIHALRDALGNPRLDPRPAAQALHELLVAPIAKDIEASGANTLMLSLDGALRYIPFAALYDGQHYLAENFALALYTLAAQSEIKTLPKADWSLSGFGLVHKVEGFSPLSGVQAELADINGVLPGSVYLDDAFNRQQFEHALDTGRPVLHVASHFVFRPGTETNSFLLLGDGKQLSLDQMRSLSFGDIDLLALSACETGVGGGKDANGREVEGFGVMAQERGAKGVLASLWPVADTSTAKLMQRFYQLRQEKKLTKGEALRRAQMEFIQGAKSGKAEGEIDRGASRSQVNGQPAQAAAGTGLGWAHPYYWAPFILIGNWL